MHLCPAFGLACAAFAAGCVDGRALSVGDAGLAGDDGAMASAAADDAGAPLPALLFTSDPTTWRLTGQNPSDYLYSPDMMVQVGGQQTARLAQDPSHFSDGGVDADAGVMSYAAWAAAAGFRTPVAAHIGMRVRMRAMIKTQDASVGAWIWFRIDAGTQTATLCNMIDGGQDRRITGTHDFTQVDCVLDIPSGATAFVYGAGLSGSGTAWFGLATFEQVGTDVPVSPRAL